MQFSHLHLDDSGRELAIRGEPGFPISMYDNDMDGYLGGVVPWHWHREIELLYVYHGRVITEIEGQRVTLDCGQGVFINSGVLHRMERAGKKCKMITMVFDPALISGAETSALYTRYVLPLTQCSALRVIWLTGAQAWHQRIVKLLSQAYAMHQAAEFGHELGIEERLMEVWEIILQENRAVLDRASAAPTDHRVKQMLEYLHKNLADPITVDDVAAAANVSARECSRCFRAALNTTPIAYLLRLRVRAAAAMLEQTDDTIAEISRAVGFESPAYFSRVFHQYTGASPRDYRKEKLLRREEHEMD